MSQINQVNESELKFLGLLESAPDAMIITGSNGKILMVNRQTEKLFGYGRHEIIGREVEVLIPEKYHQRHRIERTAYSGKPRTRPMGAGMELYGLKKDGTEFSVEISLSPLILAGEEDQMVIAAIRDITKQKESEKEIKKLNDSLKDLVIKRTADLKHLESINRELEAFSYSVSHDLRAPLRSIEGFSDKIMKEYGGIFDDKAKDYFTRIRKASRSMGTLISDLLKLSQFSQVEMKLEFTDLSSLAETIACELKSTSPERSAEFKIQGDLIVCVDMRLIRIVLQNLFDNSWKYSRNREKTQIEFGMDIKDNLQFYYIKDNGVGFDMKYADRLFKSFQRLHSNSEFEGTGIGLATVQRIIHRHQGAIWAEGKVNDGATFYFTLPKPNRQ